MGDANTIEQNRVPPPDTGPPASRTRSILRLLLANLAVWLALEGCAWTLLTLTAAPPTPSAPADGSAADKDWLLQTRLSFEGGLYEWDEHCLWRLAANYQGGMDDRRRFWGDLPLTLNEHGMRSPRVTKEKPEQVRRVLIIGGSHPMGMYVNYEESYGAVLESLLNEKTAQRWQVLNASSPGYTSFQGREYLHHYGRDFEPDIVISDLGVNDQLPLTEDFPTPDHKVRRPPHWVVDARSVLRFSAVYRLLRTWLTARSELDPLAKQRVPDTQHKENLEVMQAQGADDGFHVLLMAQFRVDTYGSGRVDCLYTEADHEAVVDTCSLWRSHGNEARRYFADPIHANAQGHALLGALVFQRLLELEWIQPRPDPT